MQLNELREQQGDQTERVVPDKPLTQVLTEALIVCLLSGSSCQTGTLTRHLQPKFFK